MITSEYIQEQCDKIQMLHQKYCTTEYKKELKEIIEKIIDDVEDSCDNNNRNDHNIINRLS